MESSKSQHHLITALERIVGHSNNTHNPANGPVTSSEQYGVPSTSPGRRNAVGNSMLLNESTLVESAAFAAIVPWGRFLSSYIPSRLRPPLLSVSTHNHHIDSQVQFHGNSSPRTTNSEPVSPIGLNPTDGTIDAYGPSVASKPNRAHPAIEFQNQHDGLLISRKQRLENI